LRADVGDSVLQATTPRGTTDISAAEKREELMEAYQRIADLQAQNDELKSVVLKMPRKVV